MNDSFLLYLKLKLVEICTFIAAFGLVLSFQLFVHFVEFESDLAQTLIQLDYLRILLLHYLLQLLEVIVIWFLYWLILNSDKLVIGNILSVLHKLVSLDKLTVLQLIGNYSVRLHILVLLNSYWVLKLILRKLRVHRELGKTQIFSWNIHRLVHVLRLNYFLVETYITTH
jgi:hypothetical protein